MSMNDNVPQNVRDSVLWKLWGKALADKWSGNTQTISALEKDPDIYVKTALQQQGIVVDTRVRFALNIPGKTTTIDTSSVVYLLPWPDKSNNSNIIRLAARPGDDGPPNPGGGSGGSGGSSGGSGSGGGGDCCCCCCVCCSC